MLQKLAQCAAVAALSVLIGTATVQAEDWLAKSRTRNRFQAARYEQPVAPTRPAAEPARRPVEQVARSQATSTAPVGAFRLGETVQRAGGEVVQGNVMQGEAVQAFEQPGQTEHGIMADEGPVFDGNGGGCPLMFDGDRGVFFAGVDYLYVRPTFSEATAYARIDEPVGDTHQELIQHEFEYRGSPRIFIGYRRLDCHAEVRFTYTNFSSTARAVSPETPHDLSTIYSIEPELQTDSGEHVVSAANIDTNLYDVEVAKTVCVGTPVYCECVGRACAPWDITFSLGARIADVEWLNQGKIYDDDNDLQAIGETEMAFSGAGPRMGIEGRRYFGQQTRFSLYGKTNFSLLLGHYELVSTQTEIAGNDRDSNQQIGKRIVPVTEMEFGASIHIRQRATISAGYLWQVYHDLGMPQEFSGQFLPYDDANILSFDGMFVRGEWSF